MIRFFHLPFLVSVCVCGYVSNLRHLHLEIKPKLRSFFPLQKALMLLLFSILVFSSPVVDPYTWHKIAVPVSAPPQIVSHLSQLCLERWSSGHPCAIEPPESQSSGSLNPLIGVGRIDIFRSCIFLIRENIMFHHLFSYPNFSSKYL